jgi:hypothetical protein
MLPKDLESINVSHLHQLVADHATESEILEFKRQNYRINSTSTSFLKSIPLLYAAG